MRKYLILFILSIFLAGISIYLIQTLNPFDEVQIASLVKSENIKVMDDFRQVMDDMLSKGLITQFLNIRNVALVVSTILLSVLSGFVLIHISIDKLFFRKFYEQPSLLVAIRRGIILCLALLSAFIYRLFAAEWYLTVLTIVLLIVVELAVGKLTGKQAVAKGEAKDEGEEKDDRDKDENETGEFQEIVEVDEGELSRATHIALRDKLRKKLTIRKPDLGGWKKNFQRKVVEDVALDYKEAENK